MAADKLNEIDLSEHEANINKIKTAWDNAIISLGKYEALLAHAGEDKDPIKTAITREKELEAARIEGSKNLIERLGREEQAAIQRNAALNNQGHAQTEEQLRAARERTQAKLESLNTAKPDADAALLKVELEKRLGQRESLGAREKDAEVPALAADEKFEAHQTELENLRKKTDEKIETLQAQLDSFQAVKEGKDTLADQVKIFEAEGSVDDVRAALEATIRTEKISN